MFIVLKAALQTDWILTERCVFTTTANKHHHPRITPTSTLVLWQPSRFCSLKADFIFLFLCTLMLHLFMFPSLSILARLWTKAKRWEETKQVRGVWLHGSCCPANCSQPSATARSSSAMWNNRTHPNTGGLCLLQQPTEGEGRDKKGRSCEKLDLVRAVWM